MLEPFIEQYRNAVLDTDQDEALRVVREAVAAGATPEQVVFEVVRFTELPG